MNLQTLDIPINPNGDALAALARFLISRDYSLDRRYRIISYVRGTGMFAGLCELGLLRWEDEPAATDAYVAALPAAEPETWSEDTDDGFWTPTPGIVSDVVSATSGYRYSPAGFAACAAIAERGNVA